MSDYSRVLLFAEKLTGKSGGALEKKLNSQTTVVSLDPSIEGSLLTTRVLVETLGRLPGKVVLCTENLSAGETATIRKSFNKVRLQPLRTTDRIGGLKGAKVHIGTQYTKGVIRAVPEGYGAHITSSPSSITIVRKANALGAVYTAALAAAEVFKIAASLTAERAPLFNDFTFCPVAFSSNLKLAPDLPEDLEINAAILGLGAIGSAIALILSELRLSGNLLLVDNERFDKPNLATYSLGGQEDTITKPWKIDLASKVLSTYSVKPIKDPVQKLPALIDNGLLQWPAIVFSSLDTVDARHSAQRIWPDFLIDPATGDTFAGIRTVSSKQPCLMCFLSKYVGTKSSLEKLAQATGLGINTIWKGDNLLSKDDLNGLEDEQVERLRPHIGKPVCGLADAFGLTGTKDNYQPAIPFVSQQAACLGVGRLLALKLGFAQNNNLIQYDVFRGPHSATILKQEAKPSCYCITNSEVINTVRTSRIVQSKQNT